MSKVISEQDHPECKAKRDWL